VWGRGEKGDFFLIVKLSVRGIRATFTSPYVVVYTSQKAVVWGHDGNDDDDDEVMMMTILQLTTTPPDC